MFIIEKNIKEQDKKAPTGEPLYPCGLFSLPRRNFFRKNGVTFSCYFVISVSHTARCDHFSISINTFLFCDLILMTPIAELEFRMYSVYSTNPSKLVIWAVPRSLLVGSAATGPVIQSLPTALASPVGWAPRISGSKGVHIFKSSTALWIG